MNFGLARYYFNTRDNENYYYVEFSIVNNMYAKIQSVSLSDSKWEVQVSCYYTTGQGNWTGAIQSFADISRNINI